MQDMTDVSEFLTKVLSAVGADALPYEEHQKWALRQHLTDLLQVLKSRASRLTLALFTKMKRSCNALTAHRREVFTAQMLAPRAGIPCPAAVRADTYTKRRQVRKLQKDLI